MKKVNTKIDNKIINPKIIEGITPFLFTIASTTLSYVYSLDGTYLLEVSNYFITLPIVEEGNNLKLKG